eukprot:1584541-Pleurochrysis_carterae.AAC.1
MKMTEDKFLSTGPTIEINICGNKLTVRRVCPLTLAASRLRSSASQTFCQDPSPSSRASESLVHDLQSSLYLPRRFGALRPC